MKPYQHFGLVRPPFEANPDPRVFYGSPLHNETLATLEYTVQANKACAIVVGESGSGKTLLARLIAAKVGRRAGVLWVHGFGQLADTTEVSVFAPGALSGLVPEVPASQTTLGQWMRARRRPPEIPLLIIDDADELAEHGWRDVIALLSREVQFPQPINTLLFGSPRLVNRIGQPQLVRLRRRVFRTCVLGPLDVRQVGEYVGCRLSAAGYRGEPLFPPEAIEHVHRLTKGNPGLINQVADNALLEAFTHDRHEVMVADVAAAARGIVGALHLLPRASGASIMLGNPLARALPAVAAPPLADLSAEPVPLASPACEPTPAAAPVSAAPAPVVPAPAAASPQLVRTTRVVNTDIVGLEQRLSYLENRLASALSAVRRARVQDEGRRAATIAAPKPDAGAAEAPGDATLTEAPAERRTPSGR